MTRFICALIAALALAGAAFATEPAALRESVEAHGPAVTLGDLFENAGPQGARAVALAPAPGRSANIPVRVVAAAASAAGLAWTPPAGLAHVTVTRAASPAPGFAGARTQAAAQAAVRRGESFTLLYAAPGVQLTTRARALEDGAVGQSIRALNPQSNRQIDVIVTGIGAATIAPAF